MESRKMKQKLNIHKAMMGSRHYLGALIAATMLTACGGSGGGGSDSGTTPVDSGDPGNPPSGQEITGDEFQNIIEAAGSGVWRITSTVSSSFSVPNGASTIDVVTDSKAVGVVAYSRGSTETVENCNGEGPKPIQIPTADDGNYCEGVSADPGSIEYLQVDANHLTVNTYCDGKLYDNSEFEKINSASSFDLGSISLTSDTYPAVDNDTGVCGARVSLDTQATSAQPSPAVDAINQTFAQIQIVTPYASSYVELELEVYRKDIVVGTYTVTESILDATETMVRANLRSPEYGGSLEDPEIIHAESGTVTIDSVSTYAVSGSVDLVMTTGDHVQGSFSVSLQ